jgi:hypothetical protein
MATRMDRRRVRIWRACAALLLGVSAAAAQDLPPGLLLLAQIKAHMRENLSTLPNFTCQMTIDRTWRPGLKKAWRRIDRIELDLTVVDRQEVYGRRGAGLMQHENQRELVPGGTVGNGEFAVIAENLFLTDNAQFQYGGTENLDGRAVDRFDYRVPLLQSQYDVTGDGKTARVAFEGSFWALHDTLDIVRIDLHANEIPIALGIDRVTDIVEYRSVPIGGRTVLLPWMGSMQIDALDGQASRNRTTFDNCHEFKGEARMLPGGAP